MGLPPLTRSPGATRCSRWRITRWWIGGNKIAALPDSVRSLELDAIGLGGNPLVNDQDERARTKQLLGRAKIFWT